MDTIPASRDVVFEDDDQFYSSSIKPQDGVENKKYKKVVNETITESAEELQTTKKVELSKEEQDKQRIKEMMKMIDNIEGKYKSIEKEYVHDRESARIEIGIENQFKKVEQLQIQLQTVIETETQKAQNTDINQDYESAKDGLLLNVLSQLQQLETNNQTKQQQFLQSEQEEKLKKDDKIKELELMIMKLQEENQIYKKEVDQLRFQPQSLDNTKIEGHSQQNNDSPQKMFKNSTEGNNRDMWLPQNELQSNDFTYFSSQTAKNNKKLKPLHKSSIPHFEYIPAPKSNLLQTSLNKELQKVVKTNRNIFLQAIKEDPTHRQNTTHTKSSEKYKQIFNTPQSEPSLGNKYRIKQLQQPQVQNQRNIFNNCLSTESLLFSRNFLHNNTHSNALNNQNAKKTSYSHTRDMNDFFFEKPSTGKSKQY